MVLSYSRLKLYALTTSKTQEILISKLVEFFEAIKGVPKTILFDNLKSVMERARTPYQEGIVNDKFKQFADDMGFKVIACIARKPETKGKVESNMKIIDDIHAYQGELNFKQLNDLIETMNREVNMNVHPTTKKVPLSLFLERKRDLTPITKKSY